MHRPPRSWLTSIELPHPVRVAVDGPDAAGKTTLAAELAARLRSAHERDVNVVSVNDFHAPAGRRYRRGLRSPDGYFEDAFDYPALRQAVLDPLAPGGTREYRRRVYDLISERQVDEPPKEAEPRAMVLVDGVFLQRPELADCWDARIWVAVSDGERLRRALKRDLGLFGSPDLVPERCERRYIPAQRRYVTCFRRADKADVIVDNEDPLEPRLTWRSAPSRQ